MLPVLEFRYLGVVAALKEQTEKAGSCRCSHKELILLPF